MIVRDILNLKGNAIHSIAPQSKVAEAVNIMVANDIGSLVVLDDGKMTGMLTFREILKGLAAQGAALGAAAVAGLMLKDPVCGNPDDSIDELRELMIRNHIRYLPVMENGRLLGVISFHDVARAVIQETSFENRLLKRYIKNRPEEESAK